MALESITLDGAIKIATPMETIGDRPRLSGAGLLIVVCPLFLPRNKPHILSLRRVRATQKN